ncbi:hypothetical protein [Streptomyces yangpuensis]|uniref:hypothetical protein n=1 Tax=Streptomyces yangpuensis TaxID=1648182 RepID=UPI00364C3CBA
MSLARLAFCKTTGGLISSTMAYAFNKSATSDSLLVACSFASSRSSSATNAAHIPSHRSRCHWA